MQYSLVVNTTTIALDSTSRSRCTFFRKNINTNLNN